LTLYNYEGPHLYKVNGLYYALVSHGGTAWNHAVSMWKSTSPFGPYEANPANPIITHRDIPKGDSFIHSVGHADLIQTQNDEWWMVLLGKRLFAENKDIMGRESFLVPVSWEGDFPIVNPGPNQGRVELTHRRPDLPAHPWPDAGPRDNFEKGELDPAWKFLRTPHAVWWNLAAKPSSLQLQLRPERLSQNVNPSFVGRRQQDLYFEASTLLNFQPLEEGEAAGMAVYRGANAHFTFMRTLHDGKPALVVTARSKKDGAGVEKVLGALPVDREKLHLKISGSNLAYDFSYSVDGKKWIPVAEQAWGGILNQYSYTGALVGLYATGPETNSVRSAAFDWFEYQPQPTPSQ